MATLSWIEPRPSQGGGLVFQRQFHICVKKKKKKREKNRKSKSVKGYKDSCSQKHIKDMHKHACMHVKCVCSHVHVHNYLCMAMSAAPL